MAPLQLLQNYGIELWVISPVIALPPSPPRVEMFCIEYSIDTSRRDGRFIGESRVFEIHSCSGQHASWLYPRGPYISWRTDERVILHRATDGSNHCPYLSPLQINLHIPQPFPKPK